jgi:two-component system sensor histidine kinase/response regulator
MTGRLNVVYQDFDLNEVIPGVVDIFKMIAETKNIELKYMGSGEPLKVHADNDMLKTVIRNFMSNAIKFSPENSSIEVSSTKEGDFARVSVRDHGVGIAADRLGNVFSDGSTTNGTIGEEGSGLGLQLCANFAHKIGGDVSVESTEGEGSTFSVTIPMKKEGEA